MPIYGHSIRDGNFFLIFAKDPQAVCKMFASHGIFIRDKSSEVPGAIRIGMGPHKVQLDVVRLIAAFNYEHVVCRPCIFDLDYTLRTGSNAWTSVPDHIREGLTPQDLIITNNGRYTTEELSRQTGIARDQIQGPIDRIINFAHSSFSRVLLIGPEGDMPDYHLITRWQPGTDVCPDEYDYLFVTYIPSLDALHTIKKMYDAAVPTYYTDSNELTTIEDYMPSAVDGLSDFMTFDLAGFMKRLFTKSMLFDKTNISLGEHNFCAIVGDSDRTDGVLAQRLELPFVKIANPSIGVKASPKKMKMSIDTFMDLRSRRQNRHQHKE
jgi:hypothetical protein